MVNKNCEVSSGKLSPRAARARLALSPGKRRAPRLGTGKGEGRCSARLGESPSLWSPDVPSGVAAKITLQAAFCRASDAFPRCAEPIDRSSPAKLPAQQILGLQRHRSGACPQHQRAAAPVQMAAFREQFPTCARVTGCTQCCPRGEKLKTKGLQNGRTDSDLPSPFLDTS